MRKYKGNRPNEDGQRYDKALTDGDGWPARPFYKNIYAPSGRVPVTHTHFVGCARHDCMAEAEYGAATCGKSLLYRIKVIPKCD